MTPPCLDCKAPLTESPASEAYGTEVLFSACYLCPFCRTHRYKSEAHAMARCRAGLERLRSSSDLTSPACS
jgi:hypothetical protein